MTGRFKRLLAVLFLMALLLAGLTACGLQYRELDAKLTTSLCSTDWISETVYWSYDWGSSKNSGNAIWLYTFREDGTGTRSHQVKYKGEDEWDKKGPYDFTYQFIHKGEDVYLEIDTVVSQDKYLLQYDAESGRIISFTGLLQCYNDYTATYRSNQTTAE